MNLSTFQIFMAIGIFAVVTFILIKFTYKRYEKEITRLAVEHHGLGFSATLPGMRN